MVKFTVDEIRKIMNKPHNIRNFSVIAHVDHGKSTLVDSLALRAGIISQDDIGKGRTTNTRKDEIERGITIKSTGISLYFEIPSSAPLPPSASGNAFLFNLIDSPGHVDFSSEVTAALRVTDGCLVVVDVVEGPRVQTETVLRQALSERIIPVLAINKLDRAFLELQLEPEEIFRSFIRVIETINVLISTYQDSTMGSLLLDPVIGNVAFCAGLQGWGFTLQQFARFYTKSLGLSEKELVQKLWGEWYYVSEDKSWTQSKPNKNAPLAICQFVLTPIAQVIQACTNNDFSKLETELQPFGVALTTEDRQKTGKTLMKAVMARWLPADDAILEMAVYHLPSPAKAQLYRTPVLYNGPLDDLTAQSISKCDPNGPLMFFVSKLVPSEKGHFYAFGRVFSGTLQTGQKVRVMGPDYQPNSKNDLYEKQIQRLVVMMGKKADPVDSVPCGNTCAIVGIDSVLQKTGTLAIDPSSCPFFAMKFSISPVVRVAVSPSNPSDLPKLSEALKKLVKTDTILEVKKDESGEFVLGCAGELHMSIVLQDLEEVYLNGLKLKVSNPAVAYRETVSIPSRESCLVKSTNKHNRIWGRAIPFEEGLAEAIESFQIKPTDDPKLRAKYLNENFNWDKEEGRKIWSFGPAHNGPNLLVDCTKAAQYLSEAKEMLTSAFQVYTEKGVLMEEPLRQVRFNLEDISLHSDPAHRGGGQILPAASRWFSGMQLTAKPQLIEPFFSVEVQCPQNSIGNVYQVLNKRRSIITEEISMQGTPLINLKAFMPVAESFGFTGDLRKKTGGQAFPVCSFSHWARLEGDPLDPKSSVHSIVLQTRKRKGLPQSLPSASQLLDKL